MERGKIGCDRAPIPRVIGIRIQSAPSHRDDGTIHYIALSWGNIPPSVRPSISSAVLPSLPVEKRKEGEKNEKRERSLHPSGPFHANHIHPSFPITPHPQYEKLPSEWGRLRSANLLRVVALSRILLFDSVVLFGSSGSGAVDRIDGGFAGGLELLEGFLEEGTGVFVGAATFHVGGDVGPEAGVVGVFDFLLGEKEVLVLLVERVVSWVEVGNGQEGVDWR